MKEKTFNPVLKEETYKSSFFPVIPIPGQKKAILLLSSITKAEPFVITNDTKVGTKTIRKGKYDQLVEIDMHPYNIKTKIEAVSNDDVSEFLIELTATAEVTEPEVVYSAHVLDVAAFVKESLAAQIQDIASEFSVYDSAALKKTLKQELGNICYLGNGISINSINIIIRLDEKYEKLLKSKRDLNYNVELEENKANAAERMKSVYSDNITAVFSRFAAGEISAEEAISRSKEGISEDFDERMRQYKEMMSYLKELENQDMIDNSNVRAKAEALVDGIFTSVPEMMLDSQGTTTKSLENGEAEKVQQNIYEIFQDDEE